MLFKLVKTVLRSVRILKLSMLGAKMEGSLSFLASLVRNTLQKLPLLQQILLYEQTRLRKYFPDCIRNEPLTETKDQQLIGTTWYNTLQSLLERGLIFLRKPIRDMKIGAKSIRETWFIQILGCPLCGKKLFKDGSTKCFFSKSA